MLEPGEYNVVESEAPTVEKTRSGETGKGCEVKLTSEGGQVFVEKVLHHYGCTVVEPMPMH